MTEIITPIKRMTLVSACTKGQLPEDVTATYADIAFDFTDEQIEELYDRLYNKPVEVVHDVTDSGNNDLAKKLLEELNAGHMLGDKTAFTTKSVPNVEHHFRPDTSCKDYYTSDKDFNEMEALLDYIYLEKFSRNETSYRPTVFFNLPEIEEPKMSSFELPAGAKGNKMLLGVLNRFLEACGLPPRSSVNTPVSMSDYAPLSLSVACPCYTSTLYTNAAYHALKVYGCSINYEQRKASEKLIARNKLLKQSLQNSELTLVMPKICANESEFVRHGTKTTLGCPVNLEFVPISILGMPNDSLVIPMLTLDILEPECHEDLLRHSGNLVYTPTGKPLEDELRYVHQLHNLPFKSLEDYAEENRHFEWFRDNFKPGILPDEKGELMLVRDRGDRYKSPYPDSSSVYKLNVLIKVLSSDQGIHNVDLRTYRKVTFALTYTEYLAIAPIVKAIHQEYFDGAKSITEVRIDAMDTIRNFYTEHKEDIDAVERVLDQNPLMWPLQYDVPNLVALLKERK